MPRPGCRRRTSSCCWWWRPACCSASGCSRFRPLAWTCGMLCIHAVIIRNCGRFLDRSPLAHRDPQVADAIRSARSALWPVLDGHPDPSRRRRYHLEHADDVPDAAGGGGIEHAGGQPADRGAGGDRAGDVRDRAEFRARAAPSTITCWPCSRSRRKAISRCSPTGCIRRRWRRWRRARKRMR